MPSGNVKRGKAIGGECICGGRGLRWCPLLLFLLIQVLSGEHKGRPVAVKILLKPNDEAEIKLFTNEINIFRILGPSRHVSSLSIPHAFFFPNFCSLAYGYSLNARYQFTYSCVLRQREIVCSVI